MEAIIGIACSVGGLLIGYFGFARNRDNDLKHNTYESTKSRVEINTKIDMILGNMTETKGSIKEIDRKFDDFKDNVTKDLARVQESCKQAHKRIDQLLNEKHNV